MPAPAAAVYVIAIAGGCAAAYAFKEFVYDPHIVPTVEKWRANYIASRARRLQRRGLAAVEVKGKGDDPISAGTELQSLGRKGDAGDKAAESSSKECENMIAKDVDEWRTVVDRSQTTIKQRRNVASGNTLDESNTFLPYAPMSPTRIIFDFSNESSPTSSHPSASASTAIRIAGPPSSAGLFSPISSIHPSDSVSLTGQATPQASPRIQPPSLSFTYDAQALSLSPPVIVSPALATPAPSSPATSTSEFVVRPSHPQDPGLELLSAPSSRPDTPFSSLSTSPGSAPGSEFYSPRISNLTIPSVPAYARNSSRTLSDVDPADFFSATSRTASEADFLSVIGDEDFDIMSRSGRSTTPSVLGDGSDLGDGVSDAGSWTSVSQSRH